MATDYERIREENISRYGWDTAVLDLLGQLYSDRTHFIFELIQNAEDAKATELAFELFADRLEVWHDGRPFDEADVRGVCGVGQSAKSGDLTAIGRFGIGFKSVYAYTRNPRIYSRGECFRIESYVRPFPLHPADGPAAGTLLVFPFDHDEVPPDEAVAEIGAALTGLRLNTLLFLRGIERLRTTGVGTPAQELRRQTTAAASTALASTDATSTRATSTDATSTDATSTRATSTDGTGTDATGTSTTSTRATGTDATGTDATGAGGVGSARRVVLARRGEGAREDEEWLVWQRGLGALGQPELRAEIAVRAEQAPAGIRLRGLAESPLVVFFGTQRETFTGFLIQGPYRTTPARDNVPGQDRWNQDLAGEAAVLLADVLRETRDAGLLTAELLLALPLDPGRFRPGSLLRPLFDAARAALASEPLIPVAGGGYAAADAVRLAGDPGLPDLLSPGQLGQLCAASGPVAWADESLAGEDAAALRRYLRDEAGLAEITAAGAVAATTEDFLAGQPDTWMARFYAFLHRRPALWQEPPQPGEQPGPARLAPVIRLEGGGQVAPFGPGGRPAAYLPLDVPAPAGLRTVRRAVAASPGAQAFLEALGFTEPDVVAEVLDGVLPGYDGLDVAALDPARHQADLELLARALDVAPAGRRDELLARLTRTTFLVAENAATGERRLMTPPQVYQRSRDLESYFDGNPAAWFAADTYGPWRAQLRGMGAGEQPGPRVREPDASGHVVIAAGFAQHERGLDGFDPEADFDGLDFALSHPDQNRSEYIWNSLLVPARHLVAGVVEKAARQGYQDAQREHVRSTMGAAAAAAAWLPGPDGAFHRPAELELDDLPPGYQRDEGLAAALGMAQAVVEAAARALGIPPDVLRGLSQRPDLVEMVRREL
ncbi:MAG TPA: hypothetical protein VGM53_30005 [Streptosporangiaceae bacterium]